MPGNSGEEISMEYISEKISRHTAESATEKYEQ